MQKEKQKLIQWHPGFCSAVQLELRDNREDLEYTNEYNVNRKPIQIDLLVIKKMAEIEISNVIGKIFRGYNIMEYKSPQDALSIDDYFKGLGYACLFKAGSECVDRIPEGDITISFVREMKKPVKLLQELLGKNRTVERVANGIYYIGEPWFSVQMVVTSELDAEDHLWLRSLTEQLTVDEAERLVFEINGLERRDEKDFADSVLQVAMSANKGAFHRVKKESDVGMCETLRELMAPEFEAELKVRVEEAMKDVTEKVTEEVTKDVTEKVTEEVTETVKNQERLATIKNIMKNLKMDAASEMSVMGLSERDQKNMPQCYREDLIRKKLL